MRPVVLTMIAAVLLLALSFHAIPVNANPIDERMFVGTWTEDYDSYSMTIEWRSDGTGTESYTDGTPTWTFEWKIEDGAYFIREDSSFDWWKMDYKFSSFYSKMSLSDSENDLNLERESNVCCNFCCGAVFIPLAIVLPVAFMIRRKKI